MKRDTSRGRARPIHAAGEASDTGLGGVRQRDQAARPSPYKSQPRRGPAKAGADVTVPGTHFASR